MQVLLRSLLAGTTPVVVDVTGGFDPAALPAAIASMTGTRRYTSLVPTQLVKTLDHPEATAALADLDAVMLGGAATPAPLLRRAVDAGVRVVRTYGMSETCGGCVYDGVPLDGARVRIGDDGRVLLGGTMIASGYRGLPEHPAFAEPGWFRTDDAGTLADGVLTIRGRLDEAISTGGLTVVPRSSSRSSSSTRRFASVPSWACRTTASASGWWPRSFPRPGSCRQPQSCEPT